MHRAAAARAFVSTSPGRLCRQSTEWRVAHSTPMGLRLAGTCVFPAEMWRRFVSKEIAKRLCDIGGFLRRLRIEARFGELSRAPLNLLRLTVQGDSVECEWMVRPADPWDSDLPLRVRERHIAEQALRDAIEVRSLLFSSLPGVTTAVLRAYRQSDDTLPELIITGVVAREEEAEVSRVPSVAMRAKLIGFHFWMDDGRLGALQFDGQQG